MKMLSTYRPTVPTTLVREQVRGARSSKGGPHAPAAAAARRPRDLQHQPNRALPLDDHSQARAYRGADRDAADVRAADRIRPTPRGGRQVTPCATLALNSSSCSPPTKWLRWIVFWLALVLHQPGDNHPRCHRVWCRYTFHQERACNLFTLAALYLGICAYLSLGHMIDDWPEQIQALHGLWHDRFVYRAGHALSDVRRVHAHDDRCRFQQRPRRPVVGAGEGLISAHPG